MAAAGRVTRVLDQLVGQADELAGLLADADAASGEVTALRGALARRSGAASAQIRAVGDIVVSLVTLAREAGVAVPPRTFQAAVRHLADRLAVAHPGQSIEVRVPPVTAVQIGSTAGPTHTRGTPPNVVETDPDTWFRLATGTLDWDAAASGGLVRASGAHASEVGTLLPVAGRPVR